MSPFGGRRQRKHPEDIYLNGLALDRALDEIGGGESAEAEARRSILRWRSEATSLGYQARADSPYRGGWPR
jgi:hypothetical protein